MRNLKKARFFPYFSVAVILGLLVAGCAPAVTPTPTPKAAPPAKAPLAETTAPKPAIPSLTPKPAVEQPRYGGTLIVSTAADPPNMDVVQEVGYHVVNVLQCAYNNLVQLDPNNPEEVIGDLAKIWEISKDGLTYTFRLQENVKFHDGTPFTAEDVKFSFDRQIDPPKGILAPRRPELVAIDRIEAADRNTAKFILKHPSSPLLNVISSGYQVIYSKGFVEKKGHMKHDVMGTGPYKLKGYASGISVEHVRNPDYFVKGRPYLDGITFYIIKDAGTRLAAFRTGRVKLTGPGHSALGATGAEIVKKEMPHALVVSYPSLQYGHVVLNTQHKPWTDLRVRRAVHLAFDRQKGIDVVVQGGGYIGSYFPGKWGIPKEELLKMPGWRQPKDADIAEAKRLLAEAGYPDGFTVKCLVRSAEEINRDIAVYFADQMAKIGIKVELDHRETAVRTKLLHEGAFSCHPFHSAYMYPDPQNEARFWTPPLRDDWGQNWARCDDKKVWELWDKQASAVDPAERMKIVRELDLRMIEVATKPIFYWVSDQLGMWPEVRDRGKLVGNYSFQKYQDIWLAK